MNGVRALRAARAARRHRLTVLCAWTALALALPGAALGDSLLGAGAPMMSTNKMTSFTPASSDPGVARIVAELSGGKTRFMRFTPAGSNDAGSRSVTVAVRVDQNLARTKSVRSAASGNTEQRAAAAGLRIAPTRYNLGLARGYQSFAKLAPISAPLSDAGIPDLAAFEPSAGVRDKPSRFAARVQLEEGVPIAQAAAPLVRRSGQASADQTLDVAGSYRLTRNLDVTAGVRYSQERDGLLLPDIDEQDSQAIYIGTQFRF